MRFILALALLTACKPPLDDRSAILPLTELRIDPPTGAKPYTPTANDVRRFRGALPSAVPPAIASQAPSYYGQFIGYVDPSGRHWIHGNFLCRIHEVEEKFFRSAYLSVSDGGACYFHVEWSPDTNATRNLSVNGDA